MVRCPTETPSSEYSLERVPTPNASAQEKTLVSVPNFIKILRLLSSRSADPFSCSTRRSTNDNAKLSQTPRDFGGTRWRCNLLPLGNNLWVQHSPFFDLGRKSSTYLKPLKDLYGRQEKARSSKTPQEQTIISADCNLVNEAALQLTHLTPHPTKMDGFFGNASSDDSPDTLRHSSSSGLSLTPNEVPKESAPEASIPKSDSGQVKKRGRKGHSKSRTGCFNCKRARIKVLWAFIVLYAFSLPCDQVQGESTFV